MLLKWEPVTEEDITEVEVQILVRREAFVDWLDSEGNTKAHPERDGVVKTRAIVEKNEAHKAKLKRNEEVHRAQVPGGYIYRWSRASAVRGGVHFKHADELKAGLDVLHGHSKSDADTVVNDLALDVVTICTLFVADAKAK